MSYNIKTEKQELSLLNRIRKYDWFKVSEVIKNSVIINDDDFPKQDNFKRIIEKTLNLEFIRPVAHKTKYLTIQIDFFDGDIYYEHGFIDNFKLDQIAEHFSIDFRPIINDYF